MGKPVSATPKPRPLELLSPAANAEVARQAILHGADAVYIGASSHGARKGASNSVDDIRELVKFAHIYRARVYVTVNTIIFEDEIPQVERLIWQLYSVGVDALIVQDMGLLRMKLPPIALHASTQCDNRDISRIRFLEKAGFSQVVLARELTLDEIRAVCASTSMAVECFIHGALCVSYSGRCYASYAIGGRSANRGECGQVCRLPFTLSDSVGKIVARDRHLLSLRDFNASRLIGEMIEAGVSSFKIEGRLKDADYVKNVTAAYRRIIDGYIAAHPEEVCRASYGASEISFTPQLDKSFNRGFTEYFLRGKSPLHIASMLTPKSLGETIDSPEQLHNGDGISFFDAGGVYTGVNVNKVEGGRIIAARNVRIPRGAEIHRTFDVKWQQLMARDTAVRRLDVDITIGDGWLSAVDERGVAATVALGARPEPAKKEFDFHRVISKLGNTPYRLRSLTLDIPASSYIPPSVLADARRNLMAMLDAANLATYRFDRRRPEDADAIYPEKSLDYRHNVANSLAVDFYRSHGVTHIEKAAECRDMKPGEVVMTTRHCILRELGLCRKTEAFKKAGLREPLYLRSGNTHLALHFNCDDCGMTITRQ